MNAQMPSKESKKKFWRRGIGIRLILYITLFSSVVTLVGTAIQLYFEYKRDLASIESNLRQIDVSYVKSISEGVWSFNDRILKVQLDGILDLPDVDYIEIISGEKPIMTAGKLTTSKSVEHIYPLKYQHRDTIQQLGTLRVVVSLNGVYQRLQQRVIVILLTQGVKTFLVSMFIFYLFYILIGRHLTAMAGYIRSLKPEELDEELIITHSGHHNEEDELGIVIKAINDMRILLQRTFNEQKQTEAELRVLDEELHSKNDELLATEKMLRESGAALQEKQDLLSQAEELGRVGGWEFDIETGQQIWTETVCDIHELDSTGQPTVDQGINFYTPASRPIIEQAVQRAIELGEPFDLELEIITAKGNLRNVHTIGKADLERRKVTGFFQDITERKQAEQEVREAAEKVRLILDSTAEAIYGIDLDGTCTFCNASFLKITGYEDAEQMLGANMHELIHHTHADGSHCDINNCRIFQTTRHGVETHVDDELFLRVDGTSFPVEYWSFPIYKNGDIVGAVVTFVDITERKQAKEALELERDSTRNILATVEAMIVALDPEGRITLVNRKACEILGYREDELLGQDWFATCLPHSIDIDQVRAVFKMSLASNLAGSEDYENPVRSRSGEERLIAWHNSSIRDKDGNIIGGLSAGEDITERRKAEEEKHVLEQQFQQTQKLESLGVLAGGIAHDFNNILAIVMGYCSLTKMDYENAEKHIPEIEKAAERAAALCRQMLAYAGKASLSQVQVNTWMLVDEMVTMLKTTIQKNVVIKAELGTDIPFIMGDASQIRQVVMNLVINAAEAIGDAEGAIDVKLVKAELKAKHTEKDHLGLIIPAGQYILFEVTDNGCGMDEETSRKIFEPFYTTKFTGRGLGMSAVLGIIKAHNGALQLESRLGHGTTFKVYLPVQISISETEEAQQKAASEPWHGSGTILLAEDEEQVRAIAIILLQELGFTVLDAENGKEALELYQQNAADINLVIADMGMPVMNGYELFYKLKQLNPKLPIIISSGFGEGDIDSKIPRKEIAGLINKPYNFDQLREVLRGVVEGCQKQACEIKSGL